jgi:hypothetical protein
MNNEAIVGTRRCPLFPLVKLIDKEIVLSLSVAILRECGKPVFNVVNFALM